MSFPFGEKSVFASQAALIETCFDYPDFYRVIQMMFCPEMFYFGNSGASYNSKNRNLMRYYIKKM